MKFIDYVRIIVGIILGGATTYFYSSYYPDTDVIQLAGMFIISSVAAAALLYFSGQGSG